MDDDGIFFAIFFAGAVGIVLLFIGLAVHEDSKDAKFEQRCEQTLNGHVEGRLCIDNDKILERQK